MPYYTLNYVWKVKLNTIFLFDAILTVDSPFAAGSKIFYSNFYFDILYL